MKSIHQNSELVNRDYDLSGDSGRNLLVMVVQLCVSLVATIILYRLYFPDIHQSSLAQVAFPVAIFHMFRFIGMSVLMPGQLDKRISYRARFQIAIGDLAVALSAVALTYFIVEGGSESLIRILAWVFLIICFTDMANIQRFFTKEKFWNKEMGLTWLLQVLLAIPFLFGECIVLYKLIFG